MPTQESLQHLHPLLDQSWGGRLGRPLDTIPQHSTRGHLQGQEGGVSPHLPGERLGLKDSYTMSPLTLLAKSASGCHGNFSGEQRRKATAQASHTKPIVPGAHPPDRPPISPLPGPQPLPPQPTAAPAFLWSTPPGEWKGSHLPLSSLPILPFRLPLNSKAASAWRPESSFLSCPER